MASKLLSYSEEMFTNFLADMMKSPEREVLRPTRFNVSDVFKGGSSSMCVAGKLHTGYIQNGDKLVLLPHTVPANVKGQNMK